MPSAEWLQAFPTSFDFYHMGTVHAREGSPFATFELESALLKDSHAVGFWIEADSRALMILLFDRELDHSTYTEMGNILASRLATELSRRHGIDTLISPPRVLSMARVERAARSASAATPRVLQKTYVHQHKNRHVPVEVLILPLDAALKTGAGHA